MGVGAGTETGTRNNGLLCRTSHCTRTWNGTRPIVSYCASSVPCTCPVPVLCSVKVPLDVHLASKHSTLEKRIQQYGLPNFVTTKVLAVWNLQRGSFVRENVKQWMIEIFPVVSSSVTFHHSILFHLIHTQHLGAFTDRLPFPMEYSVLSKSTNTWKTVYRINTYKHMLIWLEKCMQWVLTYVYSIPNDCDFFKRQFARVEMQSVSKTARIPGVPYKELGNLQKTYFNTSCYLMMW